MTTLSSVREKQKHNRRERIFNESIKLFVEKGFQETTILDIAEVAEISRGTFFNYFPYKEAILTEYFANNLQQLHEYPETYDDPFEALYAAFGELANFVENNRPLVPPLSYELLNPDAERSRAAYKALPLASIFREILLKGRAKGLVREDFSSERLARSLANVYFLTALQWAAYWPDKPIQEELRKQLKIALEGVAPGSQSIGATLADTQF